MLKAHRSLGGTGQREWPGRVFPGKKMAGQMGNEIVTVQNLKVFGTDADDNLIFVEGAVPGANGSFVFVTDSVKKVQDNLPVPTVQPATSNQESVVEEPVAEEIVETPAEEAPAEEVATEEKQGE